MLQKLVLPEILTNTKRKSNKIRIKHCFGRDEIYKSRLMGGLCVANVTKDEIFQIYFSEI
jgi:hypothetical protein